MRVSMGITYSGTASFPVEYNSQKERVLKPLTYVIFNNNFDRDLRKILLTAALVFYQEKKQTANY